MRKALREEILEWTQEQYRTGDLLVGITGSAGAFMARVDKHKSERVHWFDAVERHLVNNDCMAALESFRKRFGPRVTGSFLRDAKNLPKNIWEAASRDRYQPRDVSHYIRDGRQVRGAELLRVTRMGSFTELPLVDIEPLKGKLLSVEVEYYGKRKKDDKFGRTGNDGSLSDRDGGAEYKLTTWTPETAVRKLRELKENGIVFGACCGLHVHVDMRDLPSVVSGDTWHVLQNRFGPAVQKLVPNSRHNLHFCSFENRSPEVRYSAWNMVCLRKYGTLEWRMQGPMVRTDWRADTRWEERVATWMRVCQSITRKLALERQETGTFASLTDGNRPISWKRFLELLPEDLAEWCEIRAEMLEKGESKKNKASNAHLGEACGPVPCQASRSFIQNRNKMSGWSYLIPETLMRFIQQSCPCRDCETYRTNCVEILVQNNELYRDAIDSMDLEPRFKTLCEERLATMATVPPPDAERVIGCTVEYGGLSYYPSWLRRKIQSAMPDTWINALRSPYRVALLNDCACDTCNQSRVQAWNSLNINNISRQMPFNRNDVDCSPRLGALATSLFADMDEKEKIRQQKAMEHAEKLRQELIKRKDYKKRVPSIKSPDMLHYSVSPAKWAEYYAACDAWLVANPPLPNAETVTVQDNSNLTAAQALSHASARMQDLAREVAQMPRNTDDDELDPEGSGDADPSDDTWLSDEILSPVDLEGIASETVRIIEPVNPLTDNQ